jgi:hypothetical protein
MDSELTTVMVCLLPGSSPGFQPEGRRRGLQKPAWTREWGLCHRLTAHSLPNCRRPRWSNKHPCRSFDRVQPVRLLITENDGFCDGGKMGWSTLRTRSF